MATHYATGSAGVAGNCGGGSGGGGNCDGPGPCYPGAGNGLPEPICFSNVVRTGNCGCLIGEARVQLAGGGSKSASEVQIGDELVAPDKNGNLKIQTVVSLIKSVQPCLEIKHEKGELRCSASHQVIVTTDEALTVAGLCEDVHELLDAERNPVKVTSVRHIPAQEVFGWECEPDHVFLAEGLLHHNKTSIVSITVITQ